MRGGKAAAPHPCRAANTADPVNRMCDTMIGNPEARRKPNENRNLRHPWDNCGTAANRLTEFTKMDNHILFDSSPGLPPAVLAAVDWHAVPQRSTLMAISRAARSGWRPGADRLAEIVGYCRRALSGHPRLAHRGREALAALNVPNVISAAERPAGANVASLPPCPSCRTVGSVARLNSDKHQCHHCGRQLRLVSGSGGPTLVPYLDWETAGSPAAQRLTNRRHGVR